MGQPPCTTTPHPLGLCFFGRGSLPHKAMGDRSSVIGGQGWGLSPTARLWPHVGVFSPTLGVCPSPPFSPP